MKKFIFLIIILALSGGGYYYYTQNNDQGLQFFTTLINSCSDLMIKIINNSKPIIAEVSGIATAAGCQLAVSYTHLTLPTKRIV